MHRSESVVSKPSSTAINYQKTTSLMAVITHKLSLLSIEELRDILDFINLKLSTRYQKFDPAILQDIDVKKTVTWPDSYQ